MYGRMARWLSCVQGAPSSASVSRRPQHRLTKCSALILSVQTSEVVLVLPSQRYLPLDVNLSFFTFNLSFLTDSTLVHLYEQPHSPVQAWAGLGGVFSQGSVRRDHLCSHAPLPEYMLVELTGTDDQSPHPPQTRPQMPRGPCSN